MTDINLTELFSAPVQQPETKREYKPIPTGKYEVFVHHAQIDMSKQVPRVLINYKITQEDEFKGRIIFSSFMLNENGAPILKKALRKLGIDTAEVKSLDDLNDALSKILSTECTVFAKQREYKKQDGSTGYSHNVYINYCLLDLDNSESSDDALLKASDSASAASDDFNFD